MYMPASILPTSGARALLSDLFDYAGLFPPAARGLGDALSQWRRHRAEPARWMLGAFVLPVRMLPDLAERLDPHESIPLSLLPTGGSDAGLWIDSLHADLRSIQAFLQSAPECAVSGLEARMPADAQGDGSAEFLRRTARLLRDFGSERTTVYLEPGWSADAVARLPLTLQAIAEHNAEQATGPTFAAKLRMGGVTADAFPSPQSAAEALIAIREAGVPFKCTAGLHHPIRAHHDSVSTEMHGFLNVFAAWTFAYALGSGAGTVVRVLATTDAQAFRLSDDGLAWCVGEDASLSATPDQIRSARRRAQGIGSCSFDEPVADLAALGIATG